jgi:hypothetical protein
MDPVHCQQHHGARITQFAATIQDKANHMSRMYVDPAYWYPCNFEELGIKYY